MSITITIPGTPDASLSPNSRCHWRVKARHAKALHYNAFYASKESIARYESMYGVFVALEGVVDVHTAIGLGRGRRFMDGDNALASLKALFDGIAAAGVVGNDRQFRFHPVEQIRDKSGIGFVEVTIR